MTVDVSAFIGDYPFRALPDSSVSFLLGEMDRVGIDEAWVGHLPSFLYRDPRPGNENLLFELRDFDGRLRPVPTIHPGLPGWIDDLDSARLTAARAVRAYPMHGGMDPAGDAMTTLVVEAGERELPVLLTVRLEDLRQRSPMDKAGDLPAAAVRTLARMTDRVKLLITHASKDFIEEVNFGLTPIEARRVVWDMGWLWGPPHDELRALIDTVGVDRFVYGSGVPLRIADATPAKLDLAGLSAAERSAIESGNLKRWLEY